MTGMSGTSSVGSPADFVRSLPVSDRNVSRNWAAITKYSMQNMANLNDAVEAF